jgi:cytochrome c553/fructose-specific phosphotransferase system component IIB
MNLKKVFCKRKMAIGVLAAVYLFSWVANILAEDEEIDPRKNIIAIHDSSSEEYKKNCSECHADIPQAQSLEPSIAPAAHVAMFDFAPGKPGDDKQCIFCHRTVDLVQGSAGNIRKQVDATLCAMCHGQSPPRNASSGPVKQFYQAGPSPDDGVLLYDLACAACHKDLANSKVGGESANEIQKKIDDDKGGMLPLRVLSTVEIDSIASALGGDPNGGGGEDPNGGIDLSITKAEWKADKSELKVEGRGSAGSEVVIRNADADPIEELGFATADAEGKWKFRLKNSDEVPCQVQVESGNQFLKNKVKNAPDDCVAGPPVENIDLSITKAEWKADKSELKVEGRGSAGSEVEILDADSEKELGSATTDEDGKWKFLLQDHAGVPCRVQAESGSQFLENDVKNAPDDCV